MDIMELDFAMERVEEVMEELRSEIEAERPYIEDIKRAMEEAREAMYEMSETRRGKTKPEESKAVEDLEALITRAEARVVEIEEEEKKRKDAALKRLAKALANGSPYTSDREELLEAMKEGQMAGCPDKSIADAQETLTEIISFHCMLGDGAEELNRAREMHQAMTVLVYGGKTRPIEAAAASLEATITRVENGAILTTNRAINKLYLDLLTKPAPTSIACEALEEAIEEAVRVLTPPPPPPSPPRGPPCSALQPPPAPTQPPPTDTHPRTHLC
jgi:hypothetical protein